MRKTPIISKRGAVADSCVTFQFLQLFQKNINALTCFNFTGIYALVNKEDCEAYYSFGNAYDICNLLETIDENIDKEYYESIMQAKKVFQHSVDSKEPICIS